jgi:hypothetical protein
VFVAGSVSYLDEFAILHLRDAGLPVWSFGVVAAVVHLLHAVGNLSGDWRAGCQVCAPWDARLAASHPGAEERKQLAGTLCYLAVGVLTPRDPSRELHGQVLVRRSRRFA